jgi:toxin ParE1/3/4
LAAVAWSPEALDDLEAVQSHLAASSPSFAAVYVKRLVRAVDGLETVPRMGRKVVELDREDVREVIFQNYRLPYRLQRDKVTILAVKKMPMDLQLALEPHVWGVR